MPPGACNPSARLPPRLHCTSITVSTAKITFEHCRQCGEPLALMLVRDSKKTSADTGTKSGSQQTLRPIAPKHSQPATSSRTF